MASSSARQMLGSLPVLKMAIGGDIDMPEADGDYTQAETKRVFDLITSGQITAADASAFYGIDEAIINQNIANTQEYYQTLRDQEAAYLEDMETDPSKWDTATAYNAIVESGVSVQDALDAGVKQSTIDQIFSTDSSGVTVADIMATTAPSVYETNEAYKAQGAAAIKDSAQAYLTKVMADGVIDDAERLAMQKIATEQGVTFQDMVDAGIDPNILYTKAAAKPTKPTCTPPAVYNEATGKCELKATPPVDCTLGGTRTGWVWDAGLGVCIKDTQVTCPTGYTLNTNTQLCEKDATTITCPADYVKAGQVVASLGDCGGKKATTITCPQDYVKAGQVVASLADCGGKKTTTTITCPQDYVKAGQVVASLADCGGKKTTGCAIYQVKNAANQCVDKTCPTGQTLNKATGNCDGAGNACGVGYEYDTALMKCVKKAVTCAATEYYDPSSGNCITIPTCATGQEWDSVFKACVNKKVNTNCIDGMKWSQALGKCVSIFKEVDTNTGSGADSATGVVTYDDADLTATETYATGEDSLDTTFRESAPRTEVTEDVMEEEQLVGFDYGPAAKLLSSTGSGFSWTPPSVTGRKRALMGNAQLGRYTQGRAAQDLRQLTGGNQVDFNKYKGLLGKGSAGSYGGGLSRSQLYALMQQQQGQEAATAAAAIPSGDIAAYLAANPDVQTSYEAQKGQLGGQTLNDFARTHYNTFGKKEMTAGTRNPFTLTGGYNTFTPQKTGGTNEGDDSGDYDTEWWEPGIEGRYSMGPAGGARIFAKGGPVKKPEGFVDGGSASADLKLLDPTDPLFIQTDEVEVNSDNIQRDIPPMEWDGVERTTDQESTESKTMLENLVAGAAQIPDSVANYFIRPDETGGPSLVSPRQVGSDLVSLGGAMKEGFQQDRIGFMLDVLPVTGEVRSGMDVEKFSNMANEARASGEDSAAGLYEQLVTLSAAGTLPLIGMGARVQRRAAISAVEEAIKKGALGEAAKMLEELEYNKTLYHGTRAQDLTHIDPDKLDLGLHVGTSEQAANRLLDLGPYRSNRSRGVYPEGANILPLRVRANNPLEMEDMGEWMYSPEILHALNRHPAFTNEADKIKIQSMLQKVGDNSFSNSYRTPEGTNRELLDEINSMIQDKGYDSIKYLNEAENAIPARGGGLESADPYSYIILDPATDAIGGILGPSDAARMLDEVNAANAPRLERPEVGRPVRASEYSPDEFKAITQNMYNHQADVTTPAEMVARAERIEPGFQTAIRNITDDLGLVKNETFGVKQLKSLENKLKRGYKLGTVTDPIRTRILINTAQEADEVVNRIAELMPVQDRGFQRHTTSGYFDRKLNVMYTDPNGERLLGEIQITTPEMLEAVDGMGHRLYEVERALTERYGKTIPTTHIRRFENMQRAQQELYQGVTEKVDPRIVESIEVKPDKDFITTPPTTQRPLTRNNRGKIIFESFGGSLGEARTRLGITAERIAEFRAQSKGNKQQQLPEVQDAAKKLRAGEITSQDYLRIVEEFQPITPLGEVQKIPTNEDIALSLSKNETTTAGIVGVNLEVPDGTMISSRLDIPAYENNGTWVVTLHDGTIKGGLAVGYGPTAVLKNVNFESNAEAALKMATGESPKGTIARINGSWENRSPADVEQLARDILSGKAPDADEWVEVGMNPFRHSYFYRKSDGMPVASAEEVIQIGPVVLARKPKTRPLESPEHLVKTPQGKTYFKRGGNVERVQNERTYI